MSFPISKRAILISIEPMDPAVQKAVQEIQKINPGILAKVKKIVIHSGGGQGELGHVERGQGKDPQVIHLFKSRIEQIARQQLGMGGKMPSAEELSKAVSMALVETISHEAGHIGISSEEQIKANPFASEGTAEQVAKETMKKMKPASRQFLLSKRASFTFEELKEYAKKHNLKRFYIKHQEDDPTLYYIVASSLEDAHKYFKKYNKSIVDLVPGPGLTCDDVKVYWTQGSMVAGWGQIVETTYMPILSKRAANMACPHCKEDVSNIEPQKTPNGLYKMLTCPSCKGAFYPQDALLAVKDQKEQREFGSGLEKGWWGIWVAEMCLGFVDSEAKANLIKRTIVDRFAKNGFTGKEDRAGVWLWGFAGTAIDDVLTNAIYPELHHLEYEKDIDQNKVNIMNDVAGPSHDDLNGKLIGGVGPFYEKKRKEYADAAVNTHKISTNLKPAKESIITGGLPTKENEDSAHDDMWAFKQKDTEVRDIARNSLQKTHDTAKKFVEGLTAPAISKAKAKIRGVDPDKLCDDNKYASLSKRAKLDKLPISFDPVSWSNEQLIEAVQRLELFEGNKERFQKAINELQKRNLVKNTIPADKGEAMEKGLWAIWFDGQPRCFADSEAKANIIKRLMVNDFVANGISKANTPGHLWGEVRYTTIDEFYRQRALQFIPKELYNFDDPNLTSDDMTEQTVVSDNCEDAVEQGAGDVEDVLTEHGPFYEKARKTFIDGAITIDKLPDDFELDAEDKDALNDGKMPDFNNKAAARQALAKNKHLKDHFYDKEGDSLGNLGNQVEKIISGPLNTTKKKIKAIVDKVDTTKLSDDNKYASLSKRMIKKSYTELLLEASLKLEEIRSKYLPNNAMAEPSLPFVVSVANGSSIIKEAFKLLTADTLQPVVKDLGDAQTFNKSVLNDPNVLKRLGIINAYTPLNNFDEDFVIELSKFQEKQKLPITGKLDQHTIQMFEPPKGNFPKNFGVVNPKVLYRGGLIENLTQLEALKNIGVQRVVSLHDNPDIARMCNMLNIQFVPAFLQNGSPQDLGRKYFGDSVKKFVEKMPTYVHCYFGADRTGGFVARYRTECGWSCDLAYAEAKAYGFSDMFADLIDWFSEPCEKKLNIDTKKIKEVVDQPYKNPEAISPTPTDTPFASNNIDTLTPDTIVNPWSLLSIPGSALAEFKAYLKKHGYSNQEPEKLEKLTDEDILFNIVGLVGEVKPEEAGNAGLAVEPFFFNSKVSE